MSTQPDGFHSESLQAAIDAADDVIKNHAEIRDHVSNDIKKLESYLSANAPKEEFHFSLGEGFVADDDSSFRASMDEWGSGNGEMHEEVLSWKPDAKGRFRLYYEFRKWDACVEVDAPGGPFFSDKSTMTCESKPLIESTFDVRKTMVRHLPDFVAALASRITVDAGVQAAAELDEIPF
ncbi:hypothetical protein [Stieleria varia]|uniref:Uncharacterized protein n=1 Tax=Stieleria varia TaxID=2528005 RepID=A0A5C5ZI12_9BACT|nr:hypothetical protein [Stieleria varia]TWT87012.1 hypothetical protein Pla52n_70370 [Stieleria varia]